MTKLNKIIAMAFAILFITSISAFSQTFKIDGPKSWLGWEGTKVTGKHNGTIAIQSGSITKNKENYTGTFVIDMNSIVDEDLKDASYNGKLIGHLKSDDFFSVAKFPTSTLEITKMEAFSDKFGATHKVFGKLTIKGVTNEVSFPAKVTVNGNNFQASAEITINRTKWGLKYGSGSFFDNLGDKAISDDIKYNVNIVGSK
jgi:polyisoprenoid-binding protein YceI